MLKTPCYVYDLDEFKRRVECVKGFLKDIPLTFSIKANSFITKEAEQLVRHIEVCSPGELDICKKLSIAPEKIIYSGVMKEETDIREALSYGVDIITAESKRHIELIQMVAKDLNVNPKMIVRLSSDNQFGIDEEEFLDIIKNRSQYDAIDFYGMHYYSGTQKNKLVKIEKDLDHLKKVLEACKEYKFTPSLVEYGPGLAVEYFKENGNEIDEKLLEEVAPLLLDFAKDYPIGIEMGRYLASTCGSFHTAVKDIKTTGGTNYVILDGGIHHVKYYGQMMAMQVPVIRQSKSTSDELKTYCLCGSLCTVADVLVKSVELNPLQIDDVLTFEKCGAYSITEASTLFLSRDLPYVYFKQGEEITVVRDQRRASELNRPE